MRERESVGVHVMGIRGSVWAGGGRGGESGLAARLPPRLTASLLALSHRSEIASGPKA